MAPPQVLFDPELGAILKSMPPSAFAPIGDDNYLDARERLGVYTVDLVLAAYPQLAHRTQDFRGPDDNVLTASIYSVHDSPATALRPGFFHLHGGGFVGGGRDFGVRGLAPLLLEHDAVLVSVDYRLIPEVTSEAILGDAFAGLQWMMAHAAALGVDAARIIITGSSAGGGLSAGIALKWRDYLRAGTRPEPPLLGHLLHYPMLDDRQITVSSRQFDGTPWPPASNTWAWSRYLGQDLAARRAADAAGTSTVSIYAAPARATDLSGFSPTFLDTGSADGFRDETVDFARRLWAAGASCELHVWPGAWHGFNVFAPHARLSVAAREPAKRWVAMLLKAAEESAKGTHAVL